MPSPTPIRDRPVRVGIVGLGVMGQTHLKAHRAAAAAGLPVEVVALADPLPDRRAGKAKAAGNLDAHASTEEQAAAVREYDSFDALLNDDAVDLIDICTKTDLHVPMATAALKAGRHVLVEKPVALTAGPVRELAALADEVGRVAMPAFCMRFWPGWTHLLNAVESGEHGRLLSARFARLGSQPTWSDFYKDESVSGLALIDLHVHDTDFIGRLLGPPTSVASTGNAMHVSTSYGYDGVPHVVAEGAWDQAAGTPFSMQYRANFEHATLDFDLSRGEGALLLCRDGEATPVDLGPLTGYDGEVRHLIECLTTGRTPSPSLADAAATHAVVDAERESLRRGGEKVTI